MPVIADKSTRLIIRLVNRGCTNRPFYHVVVQKNRQPLFGKVQDQIGAFDPMPNAHQEKIMSMDFDRLRYWLANGAQPSKSVQQLLGLSGYFPIHPSTRLAAYRLQKKADEYERRRAESAEQSETQQSTSEQSETQSFAKQ